jgi:glycosyltransferase involved in cell wall biosynthesis
MRLALFSPLSPLRTAIADHVEGLLPYMAEYAQIDLFVDGGYSPSNPAIVNNFAIYNHRQFPKLAGQYDAIIYHMGDEPNFHGYMYNRLVAFPGIVVLHDLVLHHFVIGLTLAKGNVDGYVEEMRYAYGEKGVSAAHHIMAGHRQDLMHSYPLSERVIDAALGVIVHNEYARQQVLSRRPGLPVARIGQHFFLPQGVDVESDVRALREQLGLQGRFVVATFGLLIPAKQLDVSLRAFARLREKVPSAVYMLVGPVAESFDLPGLIARMGLGEAVRLVGWKDPPSFVRHMLVADLALHLRYPHIGGTPYTPIRLIGLGIPTILTNIEPLAEIPEGCCAKLDVDEYQEDALVAIMEYLATHEDARRQMGERGRRFVQAEHHPHVIARKYFDFLRLLQALPSAQEHCRDRDWEGYLVKETAAVLADWGVGSKHDHLLRPIAEAIASLDLSRLDDGDPA